MYKDFKKEVKKKKKEKFLSSQEEKKGKECPNCHEINELEARFCAECGYNFAEFKVCPYCGKKIEKKADICKFCGEWLLEGKCKFCNTDIEAGATYCAECGKLLKEIICPQCGQSSGFDFCPNCGTPLTPKAEKTFSEMKNKLEVQKVLELFQASVFKEKFTESSENSELLKMKAYLDRMEKEKKKKVYMPLFSKKQKESIKSIDKVANKEIERQEEERKEEERRCKEETERKKQEELRKKEHIFKNKAEGTVYIPTEKGTIIVQNEDGIEDDTFWLYVNDNKIGYIEYPEGGSISFVVNFNKGINKIELKFDCSSGVGTVASINIAGFKTLFGGEVNHTWMAVVDE
jgi:predicted amidophosphoribosyltransferase